jgi:hypothetical protein
MENPLSSVYTQWMANKKTRAVSATASVGMGQLDAILAPVAGMENIPAPSAMAATVHNPAPLSDFFPIITPLIADAWEKELQICNIHNRFIDVPLSIQQGFNMGVNSDIPFIYTPPNYKSALDNPDTIKSHIAKEQAAGRYSGPFSKSCLESIIGPFRSSPLGTVPKSDTPGDFRIIQDLSYPRNDPFHLSVNAEINSDDFPCDWGTFHEVCNIVCNAPPCTQAATMDVDSAFRCCPITPLQQ